MAGEPRAPVEEEEEIDEDDAIAYAAIDEMGELAAQHLAFTIERKLLSTENFSFVDYYYY